MPIFKRQKEMALRRKLGILRYLTNSKSVKESAIIMDALLYIYKLKLQLEAVQRKYIDLMHHIQEVKVETIGDRILEVKVACKKEKDLLVLILEVFESLKLNVSHVKVTTCNYNIFCLEAVVEPCDQDRQALDILRQALGAAILEVIQTQN